MRKYPPIKHNTDISNIQIKKINCKTCGKEFKVSMNVKTSYCTKLCEDYIEQNYRFRDKTK